MTCASFCRLLIIALGLAHAATGAMAQAAYTITTGEGTVTMCYVPGKAWPARPDHMCYTADEAKAKDYFPTTESPDQKLARAYALCLSLPLDNYGGTACNAIGIAWAERKVDGDADRAFIEEVARGLK